MLIDCDVHQELNDDSADLFPYLSKGWQEFVLSPQADSMHGSPETGPVISALSGGRPWAINPFGYVRKDATPPNGRTAGADPQFMAEQLLDGHDVIAAVLTGGAAATSFAGWANPHYARELARAHDDWLVDHWLAADDRYYGSIVPAIQVPQWASEEIHRLAEHPRMIQAMLIGNPHPHAFGHPFFDPIHRACAETGLPVAIHALGECSGVTVPSPTASGQPSFYFEFHATAAQGIQTHLLSFILHGVFDRYPGLKLVLVESAITWLPTVLRRFETEFKGLRREVPWCKKRPTEYIEENVRFTTQPFDVEGPDDPVIATLDAINAADLLLYSSDYPHWDTDVPTKINAMLPAAWRDRVLRENAAELYGIKLPVAS